VDDARLVVLNAMDAAEHGATILTHTRCESASRVQDQWQAALRNENGQTTRVQARSLVNAAGPWATQFLQDAAHRPSSKALRLIKGSHIVVKQLFDHPFAYIFQNPDGRIVFAINYEQDFTLIGTTDVEYHGDTNKVEIDTSEITYLCELTQRYFKKPLTPADVVWSYSGVRPLLEDESANASEITRDYKLDLEGETAPLLSVFGGKITTFRKLAEEAVDLLAPKLGNHGGKWTEHACLPGGDLYGKQPQNKSVREYEGFVNQLHTEFNWLPAKLVARYARAYGTRTRKLLVGRHTLADMGEELAPNLYATELEYLLKNEWAHNSADILWRRSKLGLLVPADTAHKIDRWIENRK
jgi:glycerol-3-phosphate dehydrogenase